MEIINDSYKLSTGKVIHPNRGIIELTDEKLIEITEYMNKL